MKEVLDILRKAVTWVLTFVRNVVLYKGWPFLVVALVMWIFPGTFFNGAAWMGFGAAIALSWDEIRHQIVKWWEKG